MAITPQSMPRATRERIRWQSLRLPFGLTPTTLALAGIVILAAVLRFANIGAIGQSNTYYTAAVKSMLQSWHNFFFVAAEPGGSVSIDKPPVAFWLQTISAYFLGVNGFAVVLPQILAGIFSVILLFHLVRRWFGNVGGLLAAFALAVMPVAIAVERNNTPDAILIFTLLLAAWAFIKATETSKLRFLLLGALMVGIGFNVKMMQALLPLPALYALYFFGSQQRWWKKIIHLGVTTLVLIPIALSWAVAVDLTPASQRPYVGSSTDNSELNLIFGYNGLQRLEGRMGWAGIFGNTSTQNSSRTTTSATSASTSASQSTSTTSTSTGTSQSAASITSSGTSTSNSVDGNRQDGGGPGGFGNAGGMFGTGQAGPLRLFQSGLAAQVSWLLPFGLLSILAMAGSVSWRRPNTALHRGLILWGGWLITCAVFFSVAGFFHQYYLAMLGAPLAAIVAMGIVFLWRLHKTHPIRTAVLMLVEAGATLAFQVYAVTMYQAIAWWTAVPIALGVVGFGLLLYGLRREKQMISRLAFTLMVAALLVVPAVWSGLTTAHSTGSLPSAYTGNSRQFGMPGGFAPPAQTTSSGTGTTSSSTQRTTQAGGDNQGVNQKLLNYLEAHTQGTKYLVVVPSSQAGAEYVLATGRPVLYAGGFSGSDPVITGDDLAKLVAAGEVRYVLWGNGDGPGGSSNSSITSYLQTYGKVVTDASLGTSTSTSTTGQQGFGGGPGGQLTLYEVGT